MSCRPWFATSVLSLLIGTTALAGNVTGRINFKGTKPAVQMIKMNADPKCVKLHGGKDVPSQVVTVNSNNTLKDVFIYVKKGLEGKTFPVPAQKITIDQQGCMYHPHIFGMMANQPLEIVNSDNFLHNIHALPKSSPPFNRAQIKQGMKNTETFKNPEVMVKIKCDVHPWMSAYVGVLTHPFYAVSGDDGSYTIKGLPAGDYEIEAWQEKYGTQTMKVTVGAGDTKTADFTFTGN